MGARRVLAGALLLLLGGAGASAEAVEAAGGGECAAGGEGSALAALLGVGKVRRDARGCSFFPCCGACGSASPQAPSRGARQIPTTGCVLMPRRASAQVRYAGPESRSALEYRYYDKARARAFCSRARTARGPEASIAVLILGCTLALRRTLTLPRIVSGPCPPGQADARVAAPRSSLLAHAEGRRR